MEWVDVEIVGAEVATIVGFEAEEAPKFAGEEEEGGEEEGGGEAVEGVLWFVVDDEDPSESSFLCGFLSFFELSSLSSLLVVTSSLDCFFGEFFTAKLSDFNFLAVGEAEGEDFFEVIELRVGVLVLEDFLSEIPSSSSSDDSEEKSKGCTNAKLLITSSSILVTWRRGRRMKREWRGRTRRDEE